MENGETTLQGAQREAAEEAGASVRVDAAFAMISIAHINQVHLFYRGQLSGGIYSAGQESLEVALLARQHIPWQKIAFRSVRYCLERYFSDRDNGAFAFHETALLPL